MLERRVFVVAGAESVGERDERSVAGVRGQVRADATNPEQGERFVIAGGARGNDAVRGVVTLDAGADEVGGFVRIVAQQIPERNGQMRGVRPRGARQRGGVKGRDKGLDFFGSAVM